MSARTKAAAITVAAALILLGSACSSSDAAEKLTEKAIEDASGGDVDVDSEDGTVKYTDENGNETEMNIDGEGASLPEDWPSELDPPDSVKLMTSNTSTTGGQKSMTVLGEAEGTIEEFASGIKAQLEDGGYEITQDTSSSSTGGGYAGMSATKGDQEVTVALADDPVSDGGITITMTVTTKA
jgi:hypothetical protein